MGHSLCSSQRLSDKKPARMPAFPELPVQRRRLADGNRPHQGSRCHKLLRARRKRTVLELKEESNGNQMGRAGGLRAAALRK